MHATRPYMRGLQNLALTLIQAKRYKEALAACDRLEDECQDDVTAAAHRASAFLNLGQFRSALDAALHIIEISPSESSVAAFASFELRLHDDARVWFLHAALNAPRTVAMVIGVKLPLPTDHDDADDHNGGVTLLRALSGYLEKRSPASRRFFAELGKSDQVTTCRKELEEVTRRWRADRPNKDRPAFDRMTRMRSIAFARETAAPMLHVEGPRLAPSRGRGAPRHSRMVH